VHSRFIFRLLVISLLLFSGIFSCAKSPSNSLPPTPLAADSPANGAYLIEKNWLQLQNGRFEQQAAPGSAAKIEVALLDEAVHADLNNDSNDDAVIFLTFQGGGSGTFYYLGTALFENGLYRGTNAILLGDRIGLPAARVQHGLITVEYLDRPQTEPMSASPSRQQKRYFILDKSSLQEIKPAEDETIYQGWLVIGHEVRTFLPCDATDDLWLLGSSPALAQIISAHYATTAGFPPYAPVFAHLSGRKAPPPGEGLGGAYQGAFYASRLIRIWPHGNCRSDFIVLETPLPGADISSPLTVRGRARGTWFFEGDFPVILLNAKGKRIAQGYVSAKGEWMTNNFVEFEGTLDFKGFPGQRGTLILRKDNPTGLAQFDDELEIPITFD